MEQLIIRRVALGLLLLATCLGIAFSTSTASYAADGGSPSIGSAIQDSGSVDFGTGSGRGDAPVSWTPSSPTQYKYEAPPSICKTDYLTGRPGVGWFEDSCWPAVKATAEYSNYPSGVRQDILNNKSGYSCSAKTVSGKRVAPVGYIFFETSSFAGFDMSGSPYNPFYTPTDWSVECVYPVVVKTGNVYNCVVGYNLNVNRLKNSYIGTAARVKNVSRTLTNVKAIEADDSKCTTNVNAAVNYNPGTKQTAWGQYSSGGTVTKARCVEYNETFEGNTDRTFKCSPAKTTGITTSYLTIWCGGFVPYLLNKSWQATDCYGSGYYTCNIPNTTTFDGKTGTVQTLRDGKARNVVWAAAKFTGNVRNSHNWERTTYVVPGSTPWDTSVDVNSNKQYFYSNKKFAKSSSQRSWVGFSNTASGRTQKLAFYTASNPGTPFSMRSQYRYDAQFLVKFARIDAYNIINGTWTARNTQAWQTFRNQMCSNTASSPRIDAIRSIGDSQNF